MSDELLPLLGQPADDGQQPDDDWPSNGEGDMEDGTEPVAYNQMVHTTVVYYDTSLPAQHIYLGNDLEELSGRTLLEDNHVLNLPLLILSNVVLIPGYILPLQLFHPSAISMIKHAILKDKTFGFINRWQMGADSLPKAHVIGTTVEVLSYKEELDEDTGFLMLRVKAVGRQRFQVQESWRQVDGITVARCCILPEISLFDSLSAARLPSSLKFTKVATSVDGREQCHSLSRKSCKKPFDDTKMPTNFTWWPSWVYRQYDPDVLMRLIKSEIKSWMPSERLECTPSDATKFSYWIAANMPIEDEFKLGLLSLNSAIQRLRAELSILKRYSVLACKVCHHEITEKSAVFSMSMTGPQGTYVNPGGFVHETITTHNVSGVALRGRPSIEHSWFPGYAWIVAECCYCRNHMGWKFVAADKTMRPETFWGLCRSSLKPHFHKEEGEKRWVPCI